MQSYHARVHSSCRGQFASRKTRIHPSTNSPPRVPATGEGVDPGHSVGTSGALSSADDPVTASRQIGSHPRSSSSSAKASLTGKSANGSD